MTGESNFDFIDNLPQLPLKDKQRLFKELDKIEQHVLTEKDKLKYLILKLDLEGNGMFIADPYSTTLLHELIFTWISNDRIIPTFFGELYTMMHLDWLIDWEKSNENKIQIRADIYDNLHTIINPLFEHLEAILGNEFRSINRSNIQVNISGIINDLLNEADMNALLKVYDGLFKVKYAIESAREYLDKGHLNIVSMNSNEYELDLCSLTHIFMRHSTRFATESHESSTSKRTYFNVSLGHENEHVEKILQKMNSIKNLAPKSTFQFADSVYKVIAKDDRIVSLYPEKES
ncbi:MAG: hypothetical protein OCD76_21480 [Reichenbachiella sp.]